MSLRKLFSLSLLLISALFITGCDPVKTLEKYLSAEDGPTRDKKEIKPRVYMDEQQGILEDFTGSSLTLNIGDDTFQTFDVSEATLECQGGMITGDEISVIYEGQLSGEDTGSVKVLKVVDEYYHKKALKDRSIYGEIQDLTCNTITIRSQAGNTITFPITGVQQYYQNGVRPGIWVYLHYKGQFPAEDPASPNSLDGSHIKVLSVSDRDPFSAPEPVSPTGDPSSQSLKQFQGTIADARLQFLSVRPENSVSAFSLDMTGVPCYFDGGIAPESRVTVVYQGEFDGKTPQGITVVSITGENTEKLKDKNVTSTVSGVIIGSTANTTTIQTKDGAVLTCYTDGVPDESTGGLEDGASIKITFHPARSRETNIYTGLKIEDG